MVFQEVTTSQSLPCEVRMPVIMLCPACWSLDYQWSPRITLKKGSSLKTKATASKGTPPGVFGAYSLQPIHCLQVYYLLVLTSSKHTKAEDVAKGLCYTLQIIQKPGTQGCHSDGGERTGRRKSRRLLCPHPASIGKAKASSYQEPERCTSTHGH